MRIAEVAPLFESVPPRLYGGTERVVSYLTEELVRQGHSVTLYGSGDSKTSARLISPCREGLRLSDPEIDPLTYHTIMFEWIAREQKNYDLIHFHTDFLHFPLSSRFTTPSVTTLHGRLDIPGLSDLYREFPEVPLISISDFQRKPLPPVNWMKTVYHGLPEDLLKFNPNPEGYLAFLGRISWEKRVDRAIEIAKKSGHRIRIAAKVDRADQEYFEEIRHLFNHPCVEYIGEINEEQKSEFLGNAKALLFPIDWPEPFGLVMIESLACGTPVIAYPHGSVPEVLEDGKTGFLVESIEQGVRAVHCIDRLDRAECRAQFRKRFSVQRMARDYLTVFQRMIDPGMKQSIVELDPYDRRKVSGVHLPQWQGVYPGDFAAG